MVKAAIARPWRQRERGGVGEVVQTSWPIVLSMLSSTAMGVVDTVFIGRLGTEELAGVALASTAATLVCSFGLGALRGVKLMAARATGAGRDDEARGAGWQGLWAAAGLGGGVVALAPLSDVAMAAMSEGASVTPHASDYFGMRCFAAPGWFVLTALTEHRQGVGESRAAMRFHLLANLTNVALDPLLIFGAGMIPALGVQGAGLATVLGFSVGATAVLASFLRRARPVLPPDLSVLRRLCKVGAPVGLTWLLDAMGWSFLVALLAELGAVEVAANVVAIRILSISFLPGQGIGEATSLLVSRRVGAGQWAEAERSFRVAMLLACATMGAISVMFIAAPETLAQWFTDDSAVIEKVSVLLLFGAAFQWLDAVAMCSMGALNGGGDTAFTMKVGLIASWGVLVPLGWLLSARCGLGATGVWIAIMAELFVRAVAQCWRWSRGYWRANGEH